jgi:hypothetical protein
LNAIGNSPLLSGEISRRTETTPAYRNQPAVLISHVYVDARDRPSYFEQARAGGHAIAVRWPQIIDAEVDSRSHSSDLYRHGGVTSHVNQTGNDTTMKGTLVRSPGKVIPEA